MRGTSCAEDEPEKLLPLGESGTESARADIGMRWWCCLECEVEEEPADGVSARGIGGYAIETGKAASFLSTYHRYQLVSVADLPREREP